MRVPIPILVRNTRGAAAAEMAMSLPLLIVIIFGAFELGNYFLTEHKVVKAVRDGSRYAARRPFTDYPGCSPSSSLEEDTRNVTRTGQVATGGTPRVWHWSDPTTITVSSRCDTSGTYTGVQVTSTIGVPTVRVEAIVPYAPLFAQLGLSDATLNLTARSEAVVMGI